MSEDAELQTRKRLEKIGKRRGLVFNKNHGWVDEVIALIASNYLRYGNYYCCCKQSHPLDPENDTVCPCPELDDEIKADGYCHCRLFFTPEAGKEQMNILETITCPG
ncbi:MAG TPA: hypothetical protein EYP58_01085 [bacterium (Candidatus Stahlbacteria)]|nr:hypothetical protein [Candidatus Stahlbacteria bacterium]